MMEILVEKKVSSERIQKTIGEVFNLEPSAVKVVGGIEEMETQWKFSVVCESRVLPGGFQSHLTIHIYDAAKENPTENETARLIAKILGTRCLISDDSCNPFTMNLVTANACHAVSLDVDRLNQKEEYWIVTYAAQGKE